MHSRLCVISPYKNRQRESSKLASVEWSHCLVVWVDPPQHLMMWNPMKGLIHFKAGIIGSLYLRSICLQPLFEQNNWIWPHTWESSRRPAAQRQQAPVVELWLPLCSPYCQLIKQVEGRDIGETGDRHFCTASFWPPLWILKHCGDARSLLFLLYGKESVVAVTQMSKTVLW